MKILFYIYIFTLLFELQTYELFSAKNNYLKNRTSKKSELQKKTKSNKIKKIKKNIVVQSTTTLLRDSSISQGVKYKIFQIGNAKKHHNVHIVELDLENSNASLKLLKAENQVGGLEKIQDMMDANDSSGNEMSIAAINANFWRALSNIPIGPLVIDGIVVEMNQYKNWSSAFFDNNGAMFIDNFSISGMIEFKKQKFELNYVNHRKKSDNIVLYNIYAGDAIPLVKNKDIQKSLKKAIEEIEQDSVYRDSTEYELEIEKLSHDFLEIERSAMLEYSYPKIQLNYLDKPAINKNIRCLVSSFDTTSQIIPKNGCVVSFGSFTDNKNLPKKGDTLILSFKTNNYSSKEFINAVSGTPRLVRRGNPQHEAIAEGSRSRRFISRQLPRTAIGTNQDQSKIYLVSTEFANSSITASLAQMSVIMRKIGCYNALNLDGGGSTSLIVGRKNVLRKNPNSCRRVCAAIAIVKNNKLKRKT